MADISSSNLEFANLVSAGKLAPGTKKQYRNKVLHFKNWMVTNYPLLVDVEGEVILADVVPDVMIEFFGHISKHKKRGSSTEYMDPIKHHAFEHVSHEDECYWSSTPYCTSWRYCPSGEKDRPCTCSAIDIQN